MKQLQNNASSKYGPEIMPVPETSCTNEHALRAVMNMNDETPAELAAVLGMTEKQLQKKLETEFTANEIDMIKQHYKLTVEQANMIFFASYELKDLQRKANAGLKRITAGKRVYDLKAKELAECWTNVRNGNDFEPLRILYYSGIEAGYRMAMNEMKRNQNAEA